MPEGCYDQSGQGVSNLHVSTSPTQKGNGVVKLTGSSNGIVRRPICRIDLAKEGIMHPAGHAANTPGGLTTNARGTRPNTCRAIQRACSD